VAHHQPGAATCVVAIFRMTSHRMTPSVACSAVLFWHNVNVASCAGFRCLPPPRTPRVELSPSTASLCARHENARGAATSA
jgi:hypothetical protein